MMCPVVLMMHVCRVKGSALLRSRGKIGRNMEVICKNAGKSTLTPWNK
jgi:hypothetical protein